MGLTNVNLSFSTGEFVAVTGESGSGKSTLAHVLGGILPYEAGELFVYGRPTSHYNASDWERYRRDLISFVSQDYGILPGNTVTENVESALRLSGMEKGQAAEEAEKILAEVELSEFAGRRAAKLSSGQKQRLSIARALAKPSKILIADEPTGNLDRENSEKVIALLKKASADRLVVLITHEFDEVKDLATRRIILQDGSVVSDVKLAAVPASEENSSSAEQPFRTRPAEKEKGGKLAPYIGWFTAKSRPVFSIIVCLFLALTAFMVFVLLGNLLIATDDTPARIYDLAAFRNGDPTRLVVMKPDREAFTQEDYGKLLNVKHVEDIERFGYACDVNYHYREDIDYTKHSEMVFEPDYDPLTNPDAYSLVDVPVLKRINAPFLRSVPVTEHNIITSGRAPEGYYEVLSADPDYKTGDSLVVYISSSRWSSSFYVRMVFDVVGETSYGSGLYFSDMLVRTFDWSELVGIAYSDGAYFFDGVDYRYITAPFDPDRYQVIEEDALTDGGLAEDHFLIPQFESDLFVPQPDKLAFGDGENKTAVVASGHYRQYYPYLVLLNEETYKKTERIWGPEQVCLFVADYAYSQRVTDAVKKMGYICVSPFKLGSAQVDGKLEAERMTTLKVCAAALIFTAALQVVLLRLLFASLNDHYKLLANVGLTSETAFGSVALPFLIYTLIGEIIAAAAVFILNEAGFARVVNIFKYMSVSGALLLFGVHFIISAVSMLIAAWGIRRAVFSKASSDEDMDFSALEEEAAE